ncbi:MAG: hypothetical protein CMF36_16930 [Leeuwenhoekiella sp.]|nr:hypothetical protein [Leeuwenhoekiella sp.]MAW96323.1 hypothetical protein [Leeuwenhoekiella sp.]MBA82814.1 hypothetical protein [Leeuwenhoekiella sp.]
MNTNFLKSDWHDRLLLFTTNPWLMIADLAELLSFIVGLIFWKKFKETSIKWFILFLGYNFFNEIAALFYYVCGLGDNNSIFYNIRQFIYFTVHLFVFYDFLQKTRFRRSVLVFYGIWLIGYIYLLTTTNFLDKYALFSLILGNFFLLIAVLFVLVEIINSLSLSEIGSNILIFIGLGLLLYLVISIPTSVTTFFGWARIGNDTGPRMEFYKILRNVGTISGALMYLIFAYGFYRSKRPDILEL